MVRRTSTCKAGPTADPDCDTSAPYLQATSCEAVLLSTVATDLYKLDSTPGNLTLTKRDCVTVADYRGFRTHVYYVSPNDQSGDGIPTLKVANLSGGDYSVTPLVEGIEQLQIEYGIDTSGDGLPDSFTSSPASAADWSNVVAVRIYVLARSADKSPGYVDPKTYVMGPKSYTPADKSYKRHLYQTEIRLNNPVGRRSS